MQNSEYRMKRKPAKSFTDLIMWQKEVSKLMEAYSKIILAVGIPTGEF